MEQRRHFTCFLIGGFLAFCLLGAPVSIVILHVDVLHLTQHYSLLRAHLMCGAFGLLGASIAAIRRYYQALITEDMGPHAEAHRQPIVWGYGWCVYYMTRPILGGILGGLVYMLSFLGLQVLIASDKLQVAPQGRLLMYAIAFVAGYAASNVMDRVEFISRRLFKTTETTDG